MFLSNFTNKGVLYLRFLNKFFRENILLYVLITLSDQSTSNESISAQLDGLHPVFQSNCTGKTFFYIRVF